jgi:membrane protease YdiL (CAAX protease family)
MATESDATGSIPPAGEPTQGPAKPHWLRNIFFGPTEIRAGWRFALFILIFLSMQFVLLRGSMLLFPVVRKAAEQAQTGGVISPIFTTLTEGTVFLLVLLATWVMSRIEKRPVGMYGVPLEGAFGKLFWQGVLGGLAFETAEVLGIYALGGYSFGSVALAGPALVKYAVMWAIAFVLVGLFEESLFRGYAQFTLGAGIGFWPSALILSALFGGEHLSNPGEGWVGALSVFVFGMFGCFMLRRTGNLWFMIGFHAAGDYAETFIYSTPDSGVLAKGALLNSSFHGPKWLTGGTIGPEGSVVDFVLMLLAFFIFARLYPAKKAGAPK